jgi:hypothetical protein
MPPVDKDIWDGSDEDMIEIIRKVAVPDLDTAKYGTGESLRQAYAISLVAGNLHSRYPNETRLADLSNALFGEHAFEGVTDVDNLSVSERDALDKVVGRSVSFSTNGVIGLCPRPSRAGR